mgnify:CR=1 FL=1
MVKAEEVRARNQLEIEKLMMKDQEPLKGRGKSADLHDYEEDPYRRSQAREREK